ncbi:c-type cytochrome [Fibrella sp. HMF5335]|uniref:C-type cytochrome n=1 Tax=Fibrella rubiginis TaxID=2817060 RepID=A0A939K5L0_9BACT|nr:c-type cytochrome [Fibrella rubiginis]MBO0936580.1 c-type cytochrome [Fibrella rubiginis]
MPYPHQKSVVRTLRQRGWWLACLLMAACLSGVLMGLREPVKSTDLDALNKAVVVGDSSFINLWTAPAESRLRSLPAPDRALIRYGRDLIANTANYLGPKGSVAHMSNGMNCQNCHLKAGTQPWGNNYAAVQATYPKFRERSGTVENQIKRVNDCFQRSLNGRPLDSSSREMQAILAYIKWLGTDLPPKQVPRGAGIFKLKGMNRPADSTRGLAVYTQKCQSCHQPGGEGVLALGGRSYTYPPLWGKHSYNQGAGLFRLSNLAGYVRYNMPLGATYEAPQLTDEEAWDVAAYINSRPRPAGDVSRDWPNLAGKPFDHPFGPYADPFSEQQHKYGPFGPIKEWKEAHK